MAVRIIIARQADFTAAQWTAIGTNSLAVKEIPDAALPEIQKRFPGTAQVAAQSAMAFIAGVLRAEVLNHVKNVRRVADQVAVETGQAAEDTSFNANYPP